MYILWLDWVSNPGSLALESDMLPTALHGLAPDNATFEIIILAVFGRPALI